jgi:hypothetical protein
MCVYFWDVSSPEKRMMTIVGLIFNNVFYFLKWNGNLAICKLYFFIVETQPLLSPWHGDRSLMEETGSRDEL